MVFNNRKAQQIARLESDLRVSNERSQALQAQVEYLVRTIRDMDQEIFNMSQRTSWEAMRPHFVKLQEEMTARKVAESKRIAEILRPGIISTYQPKALLDG